LLLEIILTPIPSGQLATSESRILL
jgi:hypothetical protein